MKIVILNGLPQLRHPLVRRIYLEPCRIEIDFAGNMLKVDQANRIYSPVQKKIVHSFFFTLFFQFGPDSYNRGKGGAAFVDFHWLCFVRPVFDLCTAKTGRIVKRLTQELLYAMCWLCRKDQDYPAIWESIYEPYVHLT